MLKRSVAPFASIQYQLHSGTSRTLGDREVKFGLSRKALD